MEHTIFDDMLFCDMSRLFREYKLDKKNHVLFYSTYSQLGV